MAEEGHRDRYLMRRCVLQSHGGIQVGVHRGNGDIQVSGSAARPVVPQLDGGPPEYQEGAPSMGPVRKANTEGGGGSVSVRIFYWSVVQAGLFFGVDTWVMLVEMAKTLEAVHVGFL